MSETIFSYSFPLMTPDELDAVERCSIVEQHSKLFTPHIFTAYKYMAMPLSSRVGAKELTGTQFLLRNYTDVRWDKRLVIPDVSNMERYSEVTMKVVPHTQSQFTVFDSTLRCWCEQLGLGVESASTRILKRQRRLPGVPLIQRHA